jgi:hypothetical protein
MTTLSMMWITPLEERMKREAVRIEPGYDPLKD